MHANKLKVNSDKTHLLVVTNSAGGDGRGREAATRRAAVYLDAGGERIQQSDNELLLGATVHNSGRWASMIRDGKASLQCQLSKRPQDDLFSCRLQDKEDGSWWHSDFKAAIPPSSVWGSAQLSPTWPAITANGSSQSSGWTQVL